MVDLTRMVDHDIQQLQDRVAELEETLRVQRREAQHQTRNMLAMVRSLVRRTGAEHGDCEHAFTLLEGRMAAFGRVQSNLQRDHGTAVELGALVGDEVLASGARIDVLTIPEKQLWVRPRAAVLLVLVWHELLAFTDLDHPVEVSWAEQDDGLVIRWTSAVVTAALRPEEVFLREILDRALPYELSASATLVLDERIECVVTLPLNMLFKS